MRKHWKKLWVVFAAACLLFSACGAPAASGSAAQTATALDPKTPLTLTLWHYYVGENQRALEDAVERFNQTLGIEKGVIVAPVAKGSIAELEEAVTNSAMGVINSEPMPDIFSSYPDKAMEIDAMGMLADLSPYFTEEEMGLYVEGFLQDGLFDGDRFLLVPIVKSTELLYVNATGFEAFAQQAGLTKETLATWEGVYEAARAYYQWKDAETPEAPWDGKGMMGFDSVANYIIIGSKQLGVDVIDQGQQKAALDEAVLRRLFDIYVKGYALGYFDAVGKFRSDDIKAEELIAYVGSSSGAAYFPTWVERDATQTPIDFMPLSYPTFEGGKPYAIQQGAGMCVAAEEAAKREGAALFLKWFTAPEQNIRFAMTTGYLPVETASYESAEFSGALSERKAGEQAQQNVAGVYEIALSQILEKDTYAAKPFAGSYEVRTILQATLLDAAEAAREAAAPGKAEGLSEEALLESLALDGRFTAWLDTLRAELDKAEIART